MTLLSYIQFAVGVILILLALHDIFQSVVLPRWSSRKWRVAPLFFDLLWDVWRKVAFAYHDNEKREDFLGSFAPAALMCTLSLWVLMMISGYGCLFWALRTEEKPDPHTFFEAMYVAGVTLLTIGYGDFAPVGTTARIVSIMAGGSGLAIFALVISFLFTLYATFERREILILTLDARAGSPPSGVALLENYAELDLLDTMPDFFNQWEMWSAQVLQSHIAYPMLPYFRSSHDRESWVASLGAVLDAATLMMTTVCPSSSCGARPLGAAQLMYRIGCHTIIDMSHWLGFRHDEDANPQPGVERAEFVTARRKLEKAGFNLIDEEASWQKFRKKRGVYAASLNEIARHLAAPPAQWVGDRSMLAFNSHRLPEISRGEPQVEAPLIGGERVIS